MACRLGRPLSLNLRWSAHIVLSPETTADVTLSLPFPNSRCGILNIDRALKERAPLVHKADVDGGGDNMATIARLVDAADEGVPRHKVYCDFLVRRQLLQARCISATRTCPLIEGVMPMSGSR